MNDQKQKYLWSSSVALIAVALITGVAVIPTNLSAVKTTNSPDVIDCSSINPGDTCAFNLENHKVKLMVPKGEGFTFGTFQIFIASLGFISDPIERDGSLESAWIFDVNGDSKKDAAIVIRNGGSGSYVDIIVLESSGDRFLITHLPPIPEVPGYMGHDSISIENGSIVRSFPTYAHKSKIRIDRQWKIKDGIEGESRLKEKPDSNVDRSGSTTKLLFRLRFR
ncbi:MAG: PliI family lysozyme inhibitor of I-type lysozyme [Sedimenticola sp.]